MKRKSRPSLIWNKSLTALQDRKETVLAKIEAQGKLTDQLKAAIEAAEKLADVEELYLPYKEKRRTKATVAREAGLFPLARLILQNSPNLKAEAEKLISEAFPTADKALAGAVDILVEAFSEDNSLRSWTYNEIWNNSDITSTLKDQSLDEKETFKIYYDFEDKVSKLQGYRTLALNRGEKLGVIKVAFKHNLEKMHRFYSARFKQKNDYIEEVINQSLKKKIIPAMERRIRSELTEAAEDGAIQLFSQIFAAFSLYRLLKVRWYLVLTLPFVQGLSWPWLTKLVSSLRRKLSIQWLQPVRLRLPKLRKTWLTSLRSMPLRLSLSVMEQPVARVKLL